MFENIKLTRALNNLEDGAHCKRDGGAEVQGEGQPPAVEHHGAGDPHESVPKEAAEYLDQKDGQLLPFPLEGLGERAGLVQAPWVNASIGENISENDVRN